MPAREGRPGALAAAGRRRQLRREPRRRAPPRARRGDRDRRPRRRAAGRGAGRDRRLDLARAAASTSKHVVHIIFAGDLTGTVARGSDLARRRRARPSALRPRRPGRDRAPPADPALPAPLAARRPGRLPRRALGAVTRVSGRRENPELWPHRPRRHASVHRRGQSPKTRLAGTIPAVAAEAGLVASGPARSGVRARVGSPADVTRPGVAGPRRLGGQRARRGRGARLAGGDGSWAVAARAPPRAGAPGGDAWPRLSSSGGQLGGLRRRVRERLREQPVGEPRVAREERAVQVRADRAPDAAALEAALAVVPEARDDAAERLRARRRAASGPAWFSNPASVRGSPGSSSHSSRTSPIIRRSPATVSSGKRPTPGWLGAARVEVEAPEQLVAAAHGEQRGAAVDRGRERRRPCAARSGAISACSRSWPPPT